MVDTFTFLKKQNVLRKTIVRYNMPVDAKALESFPGVYIGTDKDIIQLPRLDGIIIVLCPELTCKGRYTHLFVPNSNVVDLLIGIQEGDFRRTTSSEEIP